MERQLLRVWRDVEAVARKLQSARE